MITLILLGATGFFMSPVEAEQAPGHSEDLEDIEIVKKLLELQSHLREKTSSLESARD